MKRHVMYAGMISTIISGALLGTAVAGAPTDATPSAPDSSLQRNETGISGVTRPGSSSGVPTPADKRTDLTGGAQGVPHEYAGTPVPQGKLQEVTDSKWLQKPVYGMQGEVVGKIKQVLQDEKTGNNEYVIPVPSDSRTPVPLRWSQFEEKNDQLRARLNKEDLKAVLNPANSKDTSPDIQEYMSQIEQVRSAPKVGNSTGSATSAPPAVGPMGEAETTHGGPAGPQGLPEGKGSSKR